jgi:hypothetical protein
VSLLGALLRVDRYVRVGRDRLSTEKKKSDRSLLVEVLEALQMHKEQPEVTIRSLDAMLRKSSPAIFRTVASIRDISDTFKNVLKLYPRLDVATMVMEVLTGVLSTGASESGDEDHAERKQSARSGKPITLQQAAEDDDRMAAMRMGFTEACVESMVIWLGHSRVWRDDVGHGSRKYHIPADVDEDRAQEKEEDGLPWSPLHWSMWGAFIGAVDAVMDTPEWPSRLKAAKIPQKLEKEWEKVVARRDDEVGVQMMRNFREDTEMLIEDLRNAANEAE